MKRARTTTANKKGAPKKAKTSGAPFKSRTFEPERKKGELKNTDVDSTGTITFGQSTANLFLLNALAQGTGPTQRIGRNVQLKSLEYRWAGHCGGTTTGSAPLRLLIVYDRQPNGVLATAANIMATDELTGMMNLNNNRRFIVLVDELVECIGIAGPASFNVKGHRSISLPSEFGSTNGDITDIETGAVIALTWQDGGLGVASPNTHLYTRLRYDDI